MRIFKTKPFSRQLAGELPDSALIEAVVRAESGLAEAELGKFLIKLRVPRPGEGRSRWYRAIVVYKFGELAVFVHVFAKSAKPNLTNDELAALRALAKLFAEYGEAAIAKAVDAGTWIEVRDDKGSATPPKPDPGFGS